MRKFWFGAVSQRWVAAVAAGAVLGVVVGLGARVALTPETAVPDDGPSAAQAPAGGAAASRVGVAALRYAEAYAGGDWDYVIDHTLWMRERIGYVRSEQGADAVEAVRLELARHASQRTVAENHFRAGGVGDAYILRPEVRLRVVRTDAGRDDLAAPAAGRAWLRVVYANRDNALLDAAGFPLRAVTVGVNVSAEGYVLKAAVYGNLEVDGSSLAYWGERVPDADTSAGR
ncbi:MAG: hypothetical protein ACLFTT_06660 [Candidatus Hydrogenedentota bacterium]